ncbi:hypothetical protein SAMN05660420_02504 [Desulfuromusa kysingii]|uniref:Uncharacterized protein n=1 Tax=Desulfuromusa kysingii TaxID=37625 RepID=A0A1H4C9F2_9BACT|nr:hypothetical protein [Desulfuromusa kysingii]SEA56986.1 hypothetical protein SAMN05660420_02504 [Desulfuromusa kysingii]
MSEFINKAKIADLQHANAALNDEIATLNDELARLNDEIKRQGEEPSDEIDHLREVISNYEHCEKEFKERVLSLSTAVQNNSLEGDIVKELLAAIDLSETGSIEAAINRHFKNKWWPKVVTAFLLGILSSIIFWIIVAYLENIQHYNAMLKQLLG